MNIRPGFLGSGFEEKSVLRRIVLKKRLNENLLHQVAGVSLE